MRTELATGMPDDAPSRTVAARLPAPRASLWALVTDPDVPASFSEEFVGATWLETEGVGAPGLGSRFVGRNERGGRQWSVTCTITTHDTGTAFGWTVEDLDDPVSDWRFQLDDAGPGLALLRFTCRMGPSPLSGLNAAIERHPDRAAAITDGRLGELAQDMQRTVDGIAARAERDAAGAGAVGAPGDGS